VQGDRADEVVGAQQRPPLAQFVELEHPGLHPDRAGHRQPTQQLLEAVEVGGDRDRSAGAVAGGVAVVLLERLEQPRRVGRQPRQAVAGLQLRDQPRGVPGGATGELALLEHQHVGDPASSQVVGDAAADDAAADHHHLRAFGQFHGAFSPASRARDHLPGA